MRVFGARPGVVAGMIVGFAGLARSGKDTVAGILAEYGFVKYSFATPLKMACRELFGLRENQIEGDAKDVIDPRYGVTPRVMFQTIGTSYVRGIAPGAFVDRFVEWYGANSPSRVVLPDVRFQNEVDAIHTLGGKVFWIQRGPVSDDDADNHMSEQPARLLGIDGVISNDAGLDNLRIAVLDLVPVRDTRGKGYANLLRRRFGI